MGRSPITVFVFMDNMWLNGDVSAEVTGVGVTCGDSFELQRNQKQIQPSIFQYRCTVGGKDCNKYQLLDEHYQVHTGDMPCQCKKCEKGVTYRICLKTHKKQHMDDKPYECPNCKVRLKLVHPSRAQGDSHAAEAIP